MEQITLDQLTTVVGSLGFPIAVTWFLLTKGTQLVSNITIAINEMKVAVVSLGDRMEQLGDRLEELEKQKNNS